MAKACKQEPGLFGEGAIPAKKSVPVEGTPRLRKPHRDQREMRMEALEERIEADHPVRVAWKFVEGLDLSQLTKGIKSVQGHQGRSALDPRIPMALWLYATIEGVGSARQLARLCREHRAYEWICGQVTVNYHTLADFRVGHGEFLDQLLATSVAGLAQEGLVDVNTVAQDGMRIRASAAGDSFRREGTLQQHLQEAQQHVQTLKEEFAQEPGKYSARRKQAQVRAAREKVQRVEQALEHVKVLAQSREARHQGDGASTRASTTDPEARRMKMPDGGTRPAFNAQFATDLQHGFIVGVAATNAGNDSGELIPLQTQVKANTGKTPQRVLADGSYNTRENVDWTVQEKMTFYSPVREEKKQLAQGKDPYAKHKGDNANMVAHRTRMKEDDAKAIYKLRGQAAEWTNARARQCDYYQVNVRGTKKVHAVLLLLALALNLFRRESIRKLVQSKK